jgi:tight adherence protein B
MSGAALAAFAAAVCAVLGAWDGLAILDRGAPARLLAGVLAPLRGGAPPTPSERRRLALLGTATLAGAGWILAGPVLAVALAGAGPLAVRQALAVRAARRRADLVAGAPAVARALADAIAGGHSVRGALGEAARTGGVPGAAGDELRAAAGALDLGEPTTSVLDTLRRRAGDPAYDTLAAAILLQERAGGDLAALLRGLGERLDQTRRDAADARSVTAQARFTAWLVAALPAGAAILAELAEPGFLGGLAAEPLTAALGGLSLVLQLTAILAIRRIAGPAS